MSAAMILIEIIRALVWPLTVLSLGVFLVVEVKKLLAPKSNERVAAIEGRLKLMSDALARVCITVGVKGVPKQEGEKP